MTDTSANIQSAVEVRLAHMATLFGDTPLPDDVLAYVLAALPVGLHKPVAAHFRLMGTVVLPSDKGNTARMMRMDLPTLAALLAEMQQVFGQRYTFGAEVLSRAPTAAWLSRAYLKAADWLDNATPAHRQ